MNLTARECAITSLLADGLKNAEIAEQLGITEHVVKNSLRGIYDKLGFWNRTELALWYVKQTFRQEDYGDF